MPTPDPIAEMTLTTLDQVRVLADPLRVRIVEELTREERTTKQVAEVLDEKPTRLYHHVDALEKVGLIRQTRTRRNRGTLERYYRAVALRFKADAGLFARVSTPDETDTLQSVVSTIFETTGRELSDLVAQGWDVEESAKEGILSFVHLEASEKKIAMVRRRLMRLLRDLEKIEDEAPDGEAGREFRLTLAFYPLDLKNEESSE